MFEVGQTYPTRGGGTCKIVSRIEDADPRDLDAMCGIATLPKGRKRHVIYNLQGQYRGGGVGDAHYWDLLPPEPPFVTDEPVMARDTDSQVWKRRYYAFCKDGVHYCWAIGQTSWSTDYSRRAVDWRQCRRPTPEELKCPS